MRTHPPAGLPADPRLQRAAEHWDRVYANTTAPDPQSGMARALQAAHAFFGELHGKRILDLGCGQGDASIYFARHGATVYAVDTSQVAIDQLGQRVRQLGLDGIHPMLARAQEAHRLEPNDYAFGAMILHHIEPFEPFAATLAQALRPGGKAFFWENNAASRALVWFRRHFVGRLWVPRHGDTEEFPLTPDEVDALRRYFVVGQEFPEVLLFRLAGVYLFRKRPMAPFEMLDSFCTGTRFLRRYSYRQYIYLTRRTTTPDIETPEAGR